MTPFRVISNKASARHAARSKNKLHQLTAALWYALQKKLPWPALLCDVCLLCDAQEACLHVTLFYVPGARWSAELPPWRGIPVEIHFTLP